MAQSNSDNWKKGGNSVDPSDFFGSTNLADITIKTNDLPRAVFTADGHIILIPSGNGNVGIGTSTPLFPLDVNGTINTTSLFAGQLISTDTLKVGTILNVLDKICIEPEPGAGSICSKAFPLKLQSAPLFNSNTIINANNSGFVGIGTESPQAKLDVNGNGNYSGDLTVMNKLYSLKIVPLPGDSIIRFGDSTISMNTLTNRIFVSPNTCTTCQGIFGLGIGTGTLARPNNSIAIGSHSFVGTSGLNAVIIGAGTSTMPFTNNTANSLMVGFNSNLATFFVGASSGFNTTGNVGVGTSSPTEKFQVNSGNILVKGTQNFTSNGHNATLYLGDLNSSIRATFGDGITLSVFNGVNGPMDAVTIQQGGSVGIGTSNPNPGYKLSVNGKIRAKEIKVETGWSDFVFEKDYKLMPLDSVRTFIDWNGHLPNVPSAKEVESEGLDLGRSQSILLMKTEELYLYIFRQQDEIDDLKKRLDKIESLEN